MFRQVFQQTQRKIDLLPNKAGMLEQTRRFIIDNQQPRSSTCKRLYHSTKQKCETVQITFLDTLDKEHVVPAEVGKSLLDVAHDNNIELEGACGGELACATCHLIFSKEMYDTLPEKEPEEDDMLDLAFELTDTSRLGCQIIVRKDMDGMVVRMPDDGY